MSKLSKIYETNLSGFSTTSFTNKNQSLIILQKNHLSDAKHEGFSSSLKFHGNFESKAFRSNGNEVNCIIKITVQPHHKSQISCHSNLNSHYKYTKRLKQLNFIFKFNEKIGSTSSFSRNGNIGIKIPASCKGPTRYQAES